MGIDLLELLTRCERICKMRGLSDNDGPDDFRGLMVDLRSAIEFLETQARHD